MTGRCLLRIWPAILDGVGLEFKLPFQDEELKADKVAGQLTFGTAFNNHHIHGTQFIVEPDAHFHWTDQTFLYLAGIRFDSTWSAIHSANGGRCAA